MKTLTISQKQSLNKGRLKLAYLIEITLQGSGAPTLYFSDRNITIGSQVYENYLSELSGLGEEIERATSEGLNPDINLKFKNAKYKNYSYLIEIGDTYPWEGAACTSKEAYLDDNDNPSDTLTIFKGALDEPQNIDLMSFECSVSSMPIVKDEQFKQELLTAITYPSIDPDDVNKIANIIYGNCKQVKCHAIKAGACDNLVEDITNSEPSTFQLSDASEFPSSGAFTIQIENEQIRISSRSGNTLTVQTRGYNSTTAVAHSKGKEVFEVLTEYIYLVAKHSVKSIGDVYVDGIRQPSGVTKYTGQTGNEHANYPGKAVIAFTVKALLQKQVNLNANNPTHSHVDSGNQQTQNSNNLPVVVYPSSGCATLGDFRDDYINFNSIASSYNQNSMTIGFSIQMPANNCPYVVDNGYVDIGPIRVYERVGGSTTINMTSPISFEHVLSGAEKDRIYIKVYHGGAPSPGTALKCTISSVQRTVVYNSNISSTAQQTTIIGNSSADVVVGASVNCDVEGYQDDATGTYTGTANALIERPDHVIKHFIDMLYGFALTDIDISSFSAAGSSYASAISGGYKFAFVIDSGITPSQFLAELAFQCRSNLKYEGGKWYLNYLPDTSPAAVKTISKSELAGEFAKFTFNRTDRKDIINDLTAKFQKNYGGLSYDESDWLGTSITSDATSQANYGVRPQTYEFWAVRLQVMADHVLVFIKLQRKTPLLIIEFPVFWEHFDLERGDTFDINNNLYDAKKFYIEKIEREDKFKLKITGIEWPA